MDQIAVLTIGFPFGAFKLLLGLVSLKILPSPFDTLIGFALIIFSFLDIMINLLNLITLVFQNRYLTDVCLLTMFFEMIKGNSENGKAWKEFGTALDVMLSFFIVAVIVGGDLTRYFPKFGMTLWSMSVVINVLGAGLSRMMQAINNDFLKA
jgi:hypothetical protein